MHILFLMAIHSLFSLAVRFVSTELGDGDQKRVAITLFAGEHQCQCFTSL